LVGARGVQYTTDALAATNPDTRSDDRISVRQPRDPDGQQTV